MPSGLYSNFLPQQFDDGRTEPVKYVGKTVPVFFVEGPVKGLEEGSGGVGSCGLGGPGGFGPGGDGPGGDEPGGPGEC